LFAVVPITPEHVLGIEHIVGSQEDVVTCFGSVDVVSEFEICPEIAF
jgi:hypothetical protein